MATVDKTATTKIQRLRYNAVHADAMRGFAATIRMIKRQLNQDGLSLADELFWEQELARQESKRTLLKVAKEAFDAGRESITPPGPATVEQAEMLAQQIDALIADDTRTNQVIEVATDLFKLFNKVQAT